MRFVSALLLGACIVLLNQSATAGNEISVFGQPSCSQWLALTSNSKKRWLLGFLSGLNYGHASAHKNHDLLSKIKSDREIYAWMDEYCRSNPDGEVVDGAVVFFNEYKAKASD